MDLSSAPSHRCYRFPMRASQLLIVSGWLRVTLRSFLFLRVTLTCIWYFFGATAHGGCLFFSSSPEELKCAVRLSLNTGSTFGNLTPLPAGWRHCGGRGDRRPRLLSSPAKKGDLLDGSVALRVCLSCFPLKCCVIVQVSIFLGATWFRISPQLPVNSAQVPDQEAFRCL